LPLSSPRYFLWTPNSPAPPAGFSCCRLSILLLFLCKCFATPRKALGLKASFFFAVPCSRGIMSSLLSLLTRQERLRLMFFPSLSSKFASFYLPITVGVFLPFLPCIFLPVCSRAQFPFMRSNLGLESPVPPLGPPPETGFIIHAPFLAPSLDCGKTFFDQLLGCTQRSVPSFLVLFPPAKGLWEGKVPVFASRAVFCYNDLLPR